MKTKSKEKFMPSVSIVISKKKRKFSKKPLLLYQKKTKNPPLKTNDDPYLPATFTLGCFVA